MSIPDKPQRSRNGCWTCRRRRRKCDESKPTCNTCQKAGHICEGYDPKLRWDVGVASRGHLMGASAPIKESAPARFKGRQRDLHRRPKSISLDESETSTYSIEHEGIADFTASTPDKVRDMQKKTLFEEFCTSGALLLHATHADDSPLLPILPTLCQRSDTLYDVCVACQALLNYGSNETFYDYYSEAITKFRAHILNHPLRETDEAILNAALLLCTIGIVQGTPWTIHLSGMDRLLDERAAMSPLADSSIYFAQAIEVMGIMDLKVFVVGRQHPSLQVWRRYRSGQLIRCEDNINNVQSMSGLPYSMIDLLALNDFEQTEEHFWLWPGCEGTLLQSQLWDAYRFAMMLSIRHTRIHQVSHSPVKISLPNDEVLLTKALSSIDAVYNGIDTPAATNSLVMNAIILPLFHVALRVLTADDVASRHELIDMWFQRLLKSYPHANTKQALQLVQQYAQEHRNGSSRTAEDIARSDGVEIGLF